MMSAKFSDFLTPSPLVCKFTQPPLVRLPTMSAFEGTPLSADVIYGCPINLLSAFTTLSLSLFSSRFNAASGSRLARQASMPSKSVLLGNQGGGGGGGGGGPDQEAAPPARRPIMRSATSAKETILAWVQAQVNHYDVSRSRISISFNQ